MRLAEDQRWPHVMSNSKLIHHTLNKMGYYTSNPFYEDLFQEGCLLAFNLTRWFDDEKATWGTYLTMYLRQQIPIIYADLRSPVLVPRSAKERARKIIQDFLEHSESLDDDEIELLAQGSPDLKFAATVYNLSHPLSGDSHMVDREGKESEFWEIIPSMDLPMEEILAAQDFSEKPYYLAIDKAGERLSQASAPIWYEYTYNLIFLEEKLPQRYFAKKYGISQSYVARIIQRGRQLCLKELKKLGLADSLFQKGK